MPESPSTGITRRTAVGAAWTLPAIALALAAPTAAATVVTGTLYPAAACTIVTPVVNPRDRVFLRWYAATGIVPAGTIVYADARPGFLFALTDSRVTLQNLAYVAPPQVIGLRVRYTFVTTVDLDAASGDFAQVRVTDALPALPVDWRFSAIVPGAVSVSGSEEAAHTFIGTEHADACPATG